MDTQKRHRLKKSNSAQLFAPVLCPPSASSSAGEFKDAPSFATDDFRLENKARLLRAVSRNWNRLTEGNKRSAENQLQARLITVRSALAGESHFHLCAPGELACRIWRPCAAVERTRKFACRSRAGPNRPRLRTGGRACQSEPRRRARPPARSNKESPTARAVDRQHMASSCWQNSTNRLLSELGPTTTGRCGAAWRIRF